jgi:outer membrane protein
MTLVAFVFAGFTASAQSVKPIKLGHIETGKLMEIMPEVKKADETLKAKEEEFQKLYGEMGAKGLELNKELQEKGATYSELKKKNLEQELRDISQRMQSFEEMAGEQMRTTRIELLTPILEKVQKAIKQVGDENGFTYIFEMENAIRYASPASEDVLPLVKKKLGLL